VRDLWVRDENGWQYSSLAMAMRALDAKWAEAPILTVREMTTEEVDAEIMDKCSRALKEFMASPQERVIGLIGRSACRGVWNEEMSARCFRAGKELRASLSSEEADVIAELYQRLTRDTKRNCTRIRAREEAVELLELW